MASERSRGRPIVRWGGQHLVSQAPEGVGPDPALETNNHFKEIWNDAWKFCSSWCAYIFILAHICLFQQVFETLQKPVSEANIGKCMYQEQLTSFKSSATLLRKKPPSPVFSLKSRSQKDRGKDIVFWLTYISAFIPLSC